MNKQEEIRVWFENFLGEYAFNKPYEVMDIRERNSVKNRAGLGLLKLKELGVVIKMDREFPLSPYVNPATDYQRGFNQALNTTAGYVEPLIKEGK